MLNVKYRNILRQLSMQSDWTPSTQLAKTNGISKRSVKTYIADINSMAEGLIIASKKGYKVDLKKLNSFFVYTNDVIPQSPSERTVYLLKRLVNSDVPLDLYDLSDELFVSEITLKNDLRKARKRLTEHRLELNMSGETIQISGNEKNKRKLMSSLLYREANDSFLDIDKLKASFEGFDIDCIRNVIAEVFSTCHFFTNDYALTNIVLHIAIAIDRMKNGFIFTEQMDGTANLDTENDIARIIADRLERNFGVKYSESEIRDLALLISSSGTSINFMHLQLSELEEVVGIRCINLIQKILEDLRNNYYIDIEDTDFLIRFTLHIKNLLLRLENKFTSKNPLTSTLKQNAPSIYDCAVHVSITIKKETGFTLNDDEIAYIAFHLGYALEMQKQANLKITCSILFPFYYNFNAQLMDKLKKHFNEDLLVQHVVTNESELNALNSELIISAVQLNSVPKVPFVLINPLFSSGDIFKVANKINELKELKRRDSFKQNISRIMDKLLFENTEQFLIQEDALKRMCEIMEQYEYVDSGFVLNVMEREAMSTTAFGRIAIPHAIKMNATKTGMFVLISKNGIQWGDFRVNLVLLISVNKDDRKLFHEIFDSLATILTKDGNISELLTADNYQNFMDILVKCY